MAKNSPITHDHGWFISDDNAAQWTVRDSANVAIDISSWLIEWILKRRLDDPDNLLRYTIGSGLSFDTDGTDGVINLAVADTATDGFEGGEYHYALRRITAGAYKTLAKGPVALQFSAASVVDA